MAEDTGENLGMFFSARLSGCFIVQKQTITMVIGKRIQ